MTTSISTEFEEWLDLMDLDAVADPSDKIAECRFFLALAERESDAQRFRWRVIYLVVANVMQIQVVHVTAHDYRRP